MKKYLVVCVMFIILFSTFIVSAENVISKDMVNSQSPRKILTRKDIRVLSKAIVLSKDCITKDILIEIRNKVSISGSINEQEIKEIAEGFGWIPFNGRFAIDITFMSFYVIPGYLWLLFNKVYLGSFIVGIWDDPFNNNKPKVIVFLGVISISPIEG